MTISSSNIALSLVLHNEEKHLSRLVASILKQTLPPSKIYVTDNNSTDSSASLLKELLPDADIYLSKQNLGFAAAHNLNMKKAFSESVKSVFILNTDVEMDDNCTSVIDDFLSENRNIEVVAPLVFYGNSEGKTDIIQSFRIKADFKKGRTFPVDDKRVYAADSLPESAKVNYVTGTACVIRKEVFDFTGGFEELGFLYGEEMDFCYRASLKGANMAVVRDAKVWHFHDWSKKNINRISKEYYYINRNRVRFFKRYSLKSSLLRYILSEIFISPLRIRWALKTGGRKLVYYFYLGIIHGLKNRDGINIQTDFDRV